MAKALVLVLGVCLVACITGCPSPTPEGNPEAGQAVYDQLCAECHTLSNYDTVPGDGGDITGDQDVLTRVWTAAHIGQDVTEQETADLRAFVAAQSE